jgi:hypothetical protein
MSGVELTVYVINSVVEDVREHFRKVHVSGSGADATFRNQSLGWYVLFEGSQECLYFGETQPELKAGDKVKISFERTSNAKPSATSK